MPQQVRHMAFLACTPLAPANILSANEIRYSQASGPVFFGSADPVCDHDLSPRRANAG